jgi:hypothetical protein
MGYRSWEGTKEKEKGKRKGMEGEGKEGRILLVLDLRLDPPVLTTGTL